MNKSIALGLFLLGLFISQKSLAQSDSLVLKDIIWEKGAQAGATELFIPSGNSLLAGYIYRPNGSQKHPTLLLLHGYPGNERNLDLAQVVRAHGWNVIYFDYRGSWGSQGKFSFQNCVEDVVNLVSFCKKYQDSLKIDTSQMVLFGHSMGGWVCLKALEKLPSIKKGFALSAWNIGQDFKKVMSQKELIQFANNPNIAGKYFVLNASLLELFNPVIQNKTYFDLENDAQGLSSKQIIMLDEHSKNQTLAQKIKSNNTLYFDYQVWNTDHPFSNKRVSLINKLIQFLDR